MLEILKDTDRRLVMTLGRGTSRWTKFILDKDAGRAWIERRRRFLPQQTESLALDQIAAITSRGRGIAGTILLTTGSKKQLRFTGEQNQTRDAADRMRRFIGLSASEPERATRTALSMRGLGGRVAQAAALAAVTATAVWLLQPLGGGVVSAAAKTSALVTRGAERVQTAFLLPACDAPESREAIQELVRDRLGNGALLTGIGQIAQNAAGRLCTAVARRDGRTANVSYRNYWDGWTPRVSLAGEIVTFKLDAARTAAINDALDTFLTASRDSHRTGNVPRQTDQSIDKALAVIFGASDLATEPLAPGEIEPALAWLKTADRVGGTYLLAGTGYDDFTRVPQNGAIQRRLRGNVVVFADEFGRYEDFQLMLLAAVASALMRTPGAEQTTAVEIRAQLAQAMKSNFVALVYDGHNDHWRLARLRSLSRTAPVAAKFLTREDIQAVRDVALQTVDYFKDTTVRARVRDVTELLRP